MDGNCPGLYGVEVGHQVLLQPDIDGFRVTQQRQCTNSRRFRGGARRPLAKSRNAAMALLLALDVQWRSRWQIELSLFINKLSNRLIDGSGCRRIAHLAWIGKMRSADRNL
jgi:hypothetical protein